MKRTAILPLLLAAAPATGQGAMAEPIGPCRFDAVTLSFAGSPVVQAECLMQRVLRGGALSPRPLPPVLRSLLDTPGSPTPDQRDRAIAAFPEPYRAHALQYYGWPAARTSGGYLTAYFVIHDTSTPFFGERRFPRWLDRDPGVNSFEPYFADEPVAHVFLNRAGQIWGAHDLGEGWRATKLESYVVGRTARGRMVHIEVVQPRRFAKGSRSRAGTIAPKRGFSTAQYRMLAALYVYASARAGRWLIPAQHATVDAGIPDAHDDPQNFDIGKFDRVLEQLTLSRKADARAEHAGKGKAGG